ncbi:serine hydroxymethyltransferase [Prochlorococcus marinus str. MU1402]|uniref:serine hydroxymethyltransferase n=1 Tax=Prochlorococcus marinus TaxID=1219 RepID=UPI001ADB241B|nr:serine hydroxymethyltransferase [Prochlorococcus marinus]MBO8231925.1 serine hydroxymethyltransferase [Prochlorococcus marinus XMU1402]MBW3056671.1 serine hydroxymethyltransferase [Prochlorococcus marinus str. MU1402]
MEFIIFLSKLDKEILDLVVKANYVVEENKIECLLNKEIKGLHNFEEKKIIICTENAKRKTSYRNKKQLLSKDNFKTERAIRKALRHEVTHVIQRCNNNKTIGDIKKLESKLHQSKRKALEFSTSNFSGNYAKEVEAYVLEDKPKKVKRMIKKYCL